MFVYNFNLSTKNTSRVGNWVGSFHADAISYRWHRRSSLAYANPKRSRIIRCQYTCLWLNPDLEKIAR
jgi:hypothetical protein